MTDFDYLGTYQEEAEQVRRFLAEYAPGAGDDVAAELVKESLSDDRRLFRGRLVKYYFNAQRNIDRRVWGILDGKAKP